MVGDLNEVLIRREHDQVVPDAKLRQQRCDGSDLDSSLTALVTKRRRCDVVLTIRYHEGKRGKALYDLLMGLWACQSLQKFLKHKSGRDDALTCLKCATQGAYGPCFSRLVPAER